MALPVFLLGKISASNDNQCDTVSLDSPHKLHSGVSDVLSMLYMTEFDPTFQLTINRHFPCCQEFCVKVDFHCRYLYARKFTGNVWKVAR